MSSKGYFIGLGILVELATMEIIIESCGANYIIVV